MRIKKVIVEKDGKIESKFVCGKSTQRIRKELTNSNNKILAMLDFPLELTERFKSDLFKALLDHTNIPPEIVNDVLSYILEEMTYKKEK